jgi:hypothetical protein
LSTMVCGAAEDCLALETKNPCKNRGLMIVIWRTGREPITCPTLSYIFFLSLSVSHL